MNLSKHIRSAALTAALLAGGIPTMALAQITYLEITLDVLPANRAAAAAVYSKFKQPFLRGVKGALSKQLLIRDEDVQVLHGFDNAEDAKAYLGSTMFTKDVVGELGPLLHGAPDVRIYNGD